MGQTWEEAVEEGIWARLAGCSKDANCLRNICSRMERVSGAVDSFLEGGGEVLGRVLAVSESNRDQDTSFDRVPPG